MHMHTTVYDAQKPADSDYWEMNKKPIIRYGVHVHTYVLAHSLYITLVRYRFAYVWSSNRVSVHYVRTYSAIKDLIARDFPSSLSTKTLGFRKTVTSVIQGQLVSTAVHVVATVYYTTSSSRRRSSSRVVIELSSSYA